MALCAMLVGGNVLHRRCRQAGALLWMKRSLTIALGLPRGKQIKRPSAFLCAELFIPRWSYLLISKRKKRSLFLASWKCSRLDALQKAAYRRNVFNNGLFVCSSHFPLCFIRLPSACLQANFLLCSHLNSIVGGSFTLIIDVGYASARNLS